MNIEVKFNIGQEVYHVRPEDTKVWKDCQVCQGTATVEIENLGTIDCPAKCAGGKRFDHTNRKWHVIGTFVIQCIEIQLLEQKEGIRYRAHYSNYGYGGSGEHHLFATKGEAEEWCKQANKEPMGDDVYHGKDVFLKG